MAKKAKKATGLSRRQIGNRAKNVTRKQAANLAKSKGFGGGGRGAGVRQDGRGGG